jgi:prepilin-type N-terminal cleavage/methylation domain-containing protein
LNPTGGGGANLAATQGFQPIAEDWMHRRIDAWSINSSTLNSYASMPLGFYTSKLFDFIFSKKIFNALFPIHYSLFTKPAFTLAEVLVTLGIIGIVAALTLPSILQQRERKALEVAFKKSYANFYNAFNLAMMDEPPLFDYEYTTNPAPPLAAAIFSKYTKLKNITYEDISAFNKSAKTYTKQKATSPESSQNFRSPQASFIVPDGSAISVSQNSGRTHVVMDVNGIKKGPNAYGHDVFYFCISKDGKFTPSTSEAEGNYDENWNRTEGYAPSPGAACSKNNTSTINGFACATFALQNVCPDDNTKTYWECLP